MVADKPFYPVLMSSEGYESQFGYAAELTGEIGPERISTEEREIEKRPVSAAQR